MDRQENNTETQIETLLKYLEGFQHDEDKDPQIFRLRHIVLFTHQSVESLLHFLVTKKISSTLAPSNENSLLLTMSFLDPLLEEMEFFPMLRGCKNASIITPEQFEIFSEVNNHRKHFAHATSYKKEIEKYKNRDYYLKVLDGLGKAIREITKLHEQLNKSITSA